MLLEPLVHGLFQNNKMLKMLGTVQLLFWGGGICLQIYPLQEEKLIRNKEGTEKQSSEVKGSKDEMHCRSCSNTYAEGKERKGGVMKEKT